MEIDLGLSNFWARVREEFSLVSLVVSDPDPFKEKTGGLIFTVNSFGFSCQKT